MGDQPLGMAMLRDKIADIAALIPRDRPVVFLDYPVYLNVGDLLIEKATDAFFRDFGYNVTEIRSAHDFPPAHAAPVDPDATIVFQGGGNFGDLYDLHQKFREQIVGRYRRNRIVLLPQTIYFESRARLNACVEVFGAHPDLHVCVRDRGSYAFFQKHFRNPVYLFPDMAHFLWDDFGSHRRGEPRHATLLFLRADKEECPFVYQDAIGLKPIDWRDIIDGMDRGTLSVLLRWHQRHDRILPRVRIYPFWRLFREHMTGKAIRLVSDYELVVTNRLHMALLGVLMGRKVAMADNSYGKLSAYHSCWLKDIASVEMLSAREPAAPQPALAPAAV
jgi:pyruvyl transferase EpsO